MGRHEADPTRSTKDQRIAPRTTPFLGRPRRTRSRERIYAIGDIHGRLDLFEEMLRLIEWDCIARRHDGAVSSIVILGDFIDRGPDSRLLLEVLRRYARLPRFTVLLGNHEESLLNCARGLADPREGWLDFGGDATLQSYGIAPPGKDEDCYDFARRMTASIGQETLDWLAHLPLSLRSGDFFFCHAGIRPNVSLRQQSKADLLWIRQTFLDSRRDHGVVVVHGHSISARIDIAANRIGIDTGAYATGRLTTLGLAGCEIWWLQTGTAQRDDEDE